MLRKYFKPTYSRCIMLGLYKELNPTIYFLTGNSVCNKCDNQRIYRSYVKHHLQKCLKIYKIHSAWNNLYPIRFFNRKTQIT